MPVVIVLAAIIIVACAVVVALGGGGELARDQPAGPAADFGSWYDVASYRPPGALLGYDPAATERALAEAARVVAERDAEIDLLRRRLAAAAGSTPEPEAAGPAWPAE